jgi:hypothetical protein
MVYALAKSSPPSLLGASTYALINHKGIDIRTSYKQIVT